MSHDALKNARESVARSILEAQLATSRANQAELELLAERRRHDKTRTELAEEKALIERMSAVCARQRVRINNLCDALKSQESSETELTG